MNETKKATIPVLSVLCVFSVILMIFALCRSRKEEAVFIPPDFDSHALAGVPEPSQASGWSEIYREGMSYRVGICGNVRVNRDEAELYFYNTETNDVWLKLRITDREDHVIGETGLIKPNEYIKTVKLGNTPEPGETIKLKIMAYTPDTYYSAGSVTLHTSIHIGD